MPQFSIFDGHNDTLLRFYQNDDVSYSDFLRGMEGGHIDLPRARKGGLAGGFFAIWAPNLEDRIDPGSMPDTSKPYAPPAVEHEYALSVAQRMAADLFRIEAESGGQVKIARSADELQTCIETGVFAAILHIEGAEAIDADLNALEVFYQAGLRSLGIVWSRPTIFAHGVPIAFQSSPDIGPGLTAVGKRLVKRCNQLGIMIDLSHMNEAGFWDVAALSDAPLVATHSNAHALCPISRNLTDAQLDAIKASDGMVGLNFATSFLNEDGAWDSDRGLDIMVRHFDYLVERLGESRVGFGSDFDGARVPDALGDAAGLPRLTAALKAAGYDDALLHKMAHQNWLRVLRQTWQ
ncbi:MAG: dipeptidase [Chloroflexi bacterium]|nr:dipeptidase [Chloroflexota bacterium]MCY3581618.1 dipeptidase [Chloroflexota bacterium]MCY3717036.1 dipeptidase [Chloroflexota bacterium]MDE2652143.1 dipeptidase [Chloroflexota bacterium]MXX50588.1 membrane dipeptidase [Chloroflexota bacterium]